MKKVFKYTWAALALIALAACSDDTTESVSNNTTPTDPTPTTGKEVIAFSPEGSGTTRAVDDPTGFTSSTKVVMRIKAQNGTETDWDDYRYTQAIMTAAAQVSSDACNTDWGLTGAHSHLSYLEMPTNYTRYWDDAFGRNSKLTIYALAIPNLSNPTTLNNNILDHTIDGTKIKKVDDTTNPNWYTINSSATENTKVMWTVPKVQDGTTFTTYDLAYSNNIRSDVGTTDVKMKGRYKQTYSSSTWSKSMDWGRLEWEAQTGSSTVGKFDQGHLVFQHALTYLEINLTEGAGFDDTANTDFVWTSKPSGSKQAFKMIGFPITGQLDLTKALNAEGMWTPTTPTAGTDDIIQLKETRSQDNVTTFKLEGYVIPGTNLDENNSNLFEFEIDNAKYYVTGEQIATAILAHTNTNTDEATKTMAGKHYVINLTVGKTKVTNITAAILPWEDVNTAQTDAVNTHFSFIFEDRGTQLNGTTGNADKFDLYRAARDAGSFIDNITTDGTPATTTTYDYNWGTGYTEGAAPNKATKTYNSTTSRWEATNWFWKDNKTWYHFRAAGRGESTSGEVTVSKDATNGDYYTIQNGPIDGSGTYKDWVWGAPFTKKDNTYKITYTSTNGFDNNQPETTTKQIAPAIGATTDVINMLLFHMTSQITVNLTTTSGDDKVVLQDGDTKTQVKIVRFLPTGKVRMGTGKVEADGTRDTGTGVAMTDAATSHTAATAGVAEKLGNFTYGMVPQPLTGWGDAIGLEITTPDNNTYYVRDLSTITAKVSATDPYSLKETNLKNPYTLATGSTTDYVINEWFPHYKYVYNITLKKKGILDITAAILPWEVVVGNNIDIDLEN
ncbi:MAG: fimbrillin family protein [Prevotella sp.]|nr:fimbrillin family protein [Prevotella sp.]